MAKKTYTVASPEGAQRYGAEEGEEVELDLPDEEETAVVAAGWLEPAAAGKTKKGT
jgi:hypothetical protein